MSLELWEFSGFLHADAPGLGLSVQQCERVSGFLKVWGPKPEINPSQPKP